MAKGKSNVETGPQTGAPPSLEFVAVDRLAIDPAYQRATDGPYSQRIIIGMVREWKWPLCQPLVVARRDDGQLMVLDGQHRLAGARRRGDIAHLPCVVLAGIGLKGEASAFVDLNTKRQKLSQTDIFHGQLAAGDPVAQTTHELLTKTGWRVVRSTNTQSFKPGDLTCAPFVASQVRIHGRHAVETALTTLRNAYPDEAVTQPARLIGALVQIFRSDAMLPMADRIRARMAEYSATVWARRCDTKRAAQPGLSIQQGLVVVILEAAGLARAMAQAALPAIRQDKFRTAEPEWCEQCERRCTRQDAERCTSKFCKLKALPG